MSILETYGVITCDDRDQDFEGRGFALTFGPIRFEFSLTRREARQGRPAARAFARKPSDAEASRPASEGESEKA